MKRQTKSILFAVIVIAAILSVSLYAVVYHAMSPFAQRQDKTMYTPKQNVVIQAGTFNGNIEIHSTTGSQIEVIYNVTAQEGYLNDIKTFTNESKTDSTTTITTSAMLQTNHASNYKADLILNLPNTSIYNLTLNTLNGNIIKPQINDAKVAASTSNGNIDIKDGGATEIDAMAVNGNVKISLTQGTLFQVAASVGNGHITHQGITLDADPDSATRLKGATLGGEGKLSLALNSGNGNIAIEYITP